MRSTCAAPSRWRAPPTRTVRTASSSLCSHRRPFLTANTRSGAPWSPAWTTSTRSRRATRPTTSPLPSQTRSSRCRSPPTPRRRKAKRLPRRFLAGGSPSPHPPLGARVRAPAGGRISDAPGEGEGLSHHRARRRSGWFASLRVYREPRLIAILLMGFSSGLPLALTFGTLSFWLSEVGVSRTSIGLFSLVGISYSMKFLWSPVIDRMPIPLLTARLGRRRGWALAIQPPLALAILALGLTDPRSAPGATALAA